MHSITERLRFIESVFGPGRLYSNGKNFDVRCPICAPRDVNKKKLSIKVEDDRQHCWTCGWKASTLAALIHKYGTNEQFRTYCDEYMPKKRTFTNVDDVVSDAPKVTPLPNDFTLLPYASSRDPDVLAVWLYLQSRGIEARDVWYYKFGVSNDSRWRRRVIMPSFDAEGKLNFYIGRKVDDDSRRPRYDNPEDDKRQIIFNELNIDWSKRLVICEGPFDVVKCGTNAVPLLGSDISEDSLLFSHILSHNTPVALALDADMWLTKTPKIAKKFQEYNIDVTIVDVRQYGDPGKMTKQQFKCALACAKQPTWSNVFLDRLDVVSRVSLRF